MLAHLLIGLALLSARSDTLAIRAGRVLDVQTGTYESNVTLLLRDGVIAARGRNISVPAGVTIIDASRLTILAGLIDAHVHLSLRGRPRDNAVTTLRGGFTTVADLGSANGLGVRIRQLVEQDSVAGPTVVAAGSWIGGRGGVCEFGGATVRGADEARARATSDTGTRVNLLKVCLTGWLGTALTNPDSVEMTAQELRAVMQTAAAARVPVVAHAIGSAGVQLALREGIRFFAHTPVVDSATAALLQRERACVVTTMASLLPADVNGALRRSFQLLRGAGVTIGFGTDAGAVAHGAQMNEFAALIDMGMTPLEALRAATVHAAACLGVASYGTLQPGSAADLVAVDGDPVSNINVMKEPILVIRRGRVVHDGRVADR